MDQRNFFFKSIQHSKNIISLFQVSRAISTMYLLVLSFLFSPKDQLLGFQIPHTTLPLHICDAFIQSILQSCSKNRTTCYGKKAVPWSDLHFPGDFAGSLWSISLLLSQSQRKNTHKHSTRAFWSLTSILECCRF